METTNPPTQNADDQARARQAYDQEKTALTTAHNAEKDRLTRVAKDNAVHAVHADLQRALARVPGVLGAAIEDLANLAESHIGLDDNFKPFVRGDDGRPRRDPADPSRQYSVERFAEDFVKARPHFIQANVPSAGGMAGNSNGGTEWSLEKALVDLAYDQKWQAADPKGNRAAWDAHLKKLNTPVYR